MNKYILLLLAVVSMVSANAQDSKTGKPERSCSCGFSSINQLGFMEGSKGSSFLLQTINGFQYKGWFAGVGAGLEYYQVRSIPLFLDVRKTILNTPVSPFVYADAGVAVSWPRDKDKGMGGWTRIDFSNGPFFDGGLGVRISAKNNNALLFSLGYSYKYVEETRFFRGYCNFTCQEQREQYRYKLNRLSLKAGWQF